jgi:cytochrome c
MKISSSMRSLAFGLAPMIISFSALAADPAAPANAAAPVDAKAAIKLAQTKHCLRCHAVDKKKEGPPYHVIAAFYKSNPDAESVIYEHVTTPAKVKLSDGHKEYHKVILDKSPEQIRNLVRWILAQ